MKKALGYIAFVAIIVAVFLGVHHLLSPSEHQRTFKSGDEITVTQTTMGATDKEACARLLDLEKSGSGAEIRTLMETGSVLEVHGGSKGVLTDMALGYYRVRLADGMELWFPSVFIK